MQLLVRSIVASLGAVGGAERSFIARAPVVSIEDNYDRLHYAEDGAARDARYTRYVSRATPAQDADIGDDPAAPSQASPLSTRRCASGCPGSSTGATRSIDFTPASHTRWILWRIRRAIGCRRPIFAP